MAASYDNAFKDLVRRHPQALCRWLLGWPPEQPLDPIGIDANLLAIPLEADGVFRIGAATLVHVEYQARASPGDLHPRLVAYASRLFLHHAIAPRQYVVVLFGPTRLPGTFHAGGLSLVYEPLHLFELEPEPFLAEPWLLPFATLCQPAPGPNGRKELVARVAETIALVPDHAVRTVLAHHAITLANRHLDRSTLDSIFRRWTTMPLDLSDLPIFQEGRQEGRQEGQVAGAAAVLLRQLERRLGPIGEPRRAAVQRQGPASLDELAVAVLDITTLAQLDAWLTEHAGGDHEA